MTEPRRRRPSIVEESYQVDAVVSLFAILLVILLALTAATAASEHTEQAAYHRVEPPQTPFMLRSIQAPYLDRQIWRIDSVGLTRIDLAAIAARIDAARLPAPDGFSFPGIDVWFKTIPGEAGGFAVSISLHDPKAATWAAAETLAWEEEAALAALAKDRRGVLLFAAPSAFGRLPLLDAAMRAANKPFAIVRLDAEAGAIAINRTGGGAVHASVLRAQ